MTFPGILLGVVIASLIGSLYHLWRGGSLGRFFLYLVLANAGFWGGQIIASSTQIEMLPLGALQLGFAIPCCIAILALGHWLSLVEVKTKE